MKVFGGNVILYFQELSNYLSKLIIEEYFVPYSHFMRPGFPWERSKWYANQKEQNFSLDLKRFSYEGGFSEFF